jgi:magnesium transporter
MRRDAATTIFQRFLEADPRHAALSLESQEPAAAAEILKGLSALSAARCLELLSPSYTAKVLELMFPEPASSILERMNPDHVAAVFRSLPEAARHAAVTALTPELSRQVLEILTYPEDSAGRIMRTDVVAFSKDTKVKDVIAKLRHQGPARTPTYTYVVGEENKLVGVLNMRDLLMADANAPAEAIMRPDVFCVSAFTDREELMHQVSTHHYVSFPVVDAQQRLIGAVRTADLVEDSQEEATEDLQLLFGASGDERVTSSIWVKVRQRLPWLNINLATAFVAGAVIAHYEDLIGRIAVLAVYLPIIAGQGGNAGIQTLSVVLRGLVMREIKFGDKTAVALILKEAATGALNGLAIGVVTGLVAWLWQGNPYLGLLVALAMIANMLAAGLAGAAIPLVMKKMGFDPAQSSGIFVTTVTDVVGFLAFLGFATIFESKLL